MTPRIGAIIREARKAQGLTQEQLAGLLHVSRQTVSHWENGRAEPGYEMLKALADTLELDLALLFGDASGEGQPDGQDDVPPTDGAQTPACDANPPQAHPVRGALLRRLSLPLAVCLLLLAVFAGAAFLHLRTPYPLRWFAQADVAGDDQPLMRLYTHESPILRKGDGKNGKWEFHLFMKEQNGHAFEVGSLQLVWFGKNGRQHIETLSAEEFSAHTGSTRIGPGEIRFITICKPTSYDLVRFGCILRGMDEAGQSLTFRMTVPLE